MKKILVFSDSHGDNEIMKKIISKTNPDLVIHAGDYCCVENQLEQFVDYFCCGNMDPEKMSGNGSRVVKFSFEGLNFLITHSDLQAPFVYRIEDVIQKLKRDFIDEKIDVFILGHSHQEEFIFKDNVYYINPGSITLPRNRSGIKTYAELIVANGKIINATKNEAIRYFSENN